MRTLSADLLAAQQSPGGAPEVAVTLSDRLAGLPRLRWQRLYTGAEDDYYHAAVCAADGTLVRARISSAHQLYVQAVASPGPGGAFGGWTSVAAVSSVAAVALAADSARVLLFSVAADQVTIQARESLDNGQTFGSPATVAVAGSAVGLLASAISDGGQVRLFYTQGATMYSVARTGGVWGAPAAWTNSVAGVTGLACGYHLDWDIAVTGSDTAGDNHVWTGLLGDGYAEAPGVWSALTSIARANSGANVNFQAPFADVFDTERLWFVEAYTGAGGYSRPYGASVVQGATFADGLWLEPAPFDLTCGYGVALAHDASSAWLSTPFGVWQAARYAPPTDVSGDVLELELRAEPYGGGARVVLNNSHARYNAAGQPATAGAELEVRLGCRTPAGPQFVATQAFWLHAVNHQCSPGGATVVAEAVNAWGLLERWRARQQFVWAAGARNLYQLLAFVLGRAGLSLGIISSSAEFVSSTPAFTIHPGESGAVAARRLLANTDDLLVFEGDLGYVVRPSPSDTAVYSYGAAHPLLRARYAEATAGLPQVQVFGAGVYGEAFDWAAADAWRTGSHQVIDANVTTAAAAAVRAAAEVRRSAVLADAGWLEARLNCGQQLYDVVDITDGRAGVLNQQRRVTAVHAHYRRRGEPRYHMTLRLGGV